MSARLPGKWIGIPVVLALVAGVALFAAWSPIKLHYLSHKLETASTPESRQSAINLLLECGDPGYAALSQYLARQPETSLKEIETEWKVVFEHSHGARFLSNLLNHMGDFPEPTQGFVIRNAMQGFAGLDPREQESRRLAIRQSLANAGSSVKIAAVMVAATPELGLYAEVKPLLRDTDPQVRNAALVMLGSRTTTKALTDEEVFTCLHDDNLEVRRSAEAILVVHGRSEDEIDLGRRLTDPRPVERLQLLVALSREKNRDIGPWLERLSHDPVPAVRAGAARLAMEARLPFANWIDLLATQDPDPMVRGIAQYHRSRNGLTTVGGP